MRFAHTGPDGYDVDFTTTPHEVLVRFRLNRVHRAVKRGKSVLAVTDQYTPGTDETIGTVVTQGQATVTIDLRELISLAFTASANKNKKSQSGPVEAIFTGTREFK